MIPADGVALPHIDSCGYLGRVALLYGLSVAVLVALAISTVYLADGTSIRVSGLGFTTAASVLVLDGITVLGVLGDVLADADLTLLVICASRFMLLAAGTRYWLLGTSLAYLVYAVFLAHKVVARLKAGWLTALFEGEINGPMRVNGTAAVHAESGGAIAGSYKSETDKEDGSIGRRGPETDAAPQDVPATSEKNSST